MKLVTIVIAMIFALGAAGVSISAQGRGNGQARKTATKPAKTQTRPVKTETRAAKTTAKSAKTNPNQEARLLAMLPPGTNIQDASQGFKNRGQFIAAVNASSNHNIPFADLKAKMTGIAPGGTEPTMAPMSLGQAMQSFKGTTPPQQP